MPRHAGRTRRDGQDVRGRGRPQPPRPGQVQPPRSQHVRSGRCLSIVLDPRSNSWLESYERATERGGAGREGSMVMWPCLNQSEDLHFWSLLCGTFHILLYAPLCTSPITWYKNIASGPTPRLAFLFCFVFCRFETQNVYSLAQLYFVIMERSANKLFLYNDNLTIWYFDEHKSSWKCESSVSFKMRLIIYV